jgi:hypothetical protein
MIDMAKRHEIQVLRRAGHSRREVAELGGVDQHRVPGSTICPLPEAHSRPLGMSSGSQCFQSERLPRTVNWCRAVGSSRGCDRGARGTKLGEWAV